MNVGTNTFIATIIMFYFSRADGHLKSTDFGYLFLHPSRNTQNCYTTCRAKGYEREYVNTRQIYESIISVQSQSVQITATGTTSNCIVLRRTALTQQNSEHKVQRNFSREMTKLWLSNERYFGHAQ